MKRRQKAGFLGPISSNRTKEGKEKEKRKSEEEGRSRTQKSNGCTLSSYNGYFGDSFLPKKNCWTEKIHLAVMFSNSARYAIKD